jgi:hypothetical protein
VIYCLIMVVLLWNVVSSSFILCKKRGFSEDLVLGYRVQVNLLGVMLFVFMPWAVFVFFFQ